MMRPRLAFVLVTLLVAPPGDAQVQIDLAVTPAELSIWGGVPREETGQSLHVGDINGDGSPDVLFMQVYWANPALDEVGRVCAYFGPLSLPGEHDLFDETPDMCIEGTTLNVLFYIESTVLAADIDGDGIHDLLFPTKSGFSIFRGRTVWPTVLTVKDADWSFAAADSDDNLIVVSAGDLNGDGALDLAFFAGLADGPSNGRVHAGEGYVFFGPATGWPKMHFDLAVDAPDVIIYGADGRADNPCCAGDQLGFTEGAAVIANVLGDDTADLIVAASGSAGKDNLVATQGSVYVLRGRSVWPSVIDLRTPGTADLVVHGPLEGGVSRAVAAADIDGDGQSDLLIASRGYSRPGLGRSYSGGIFVLRGGATLGGVWELETKEADATIVGTAMLSFLGWSLEVGDVNGDGFIDILAGASADPFVRQGAGAVVVISGCEGFEPLRDLAVRPAELTIFGADEKDFLGRVVRAHDFDGDGRDDILAAARGGHGRDNLRGEAAGEIHLVLGQALGGPVCTITPDPGAAVEICGTTTDVTLDGSQSSVTNCSVTPQYRWMDGTTELRGWDVDPTFVVRPTATTEYRLEGRCGDCAGPCFETATVLVTVDPDVTPPSLGNTVRAYRAGTDVELLWGSVTEARTYSLYRGTQKEIWPPALLSSLTTTTATLADVPGPPNQYFYRVSGASCSGNEGP